VIAVSFCSSRSMGDDAAALEKPTVIAQTGTATKPPPTVLRDDPYSQFEIITRLYGSAG
jgi:hypothetical protein